MEIYDILKELREERHISQRKLADELSSYCAITQQKISEIELGNQKIDSEIIIAYSLYFEVSTDYILGQTNVRSINDDIRFCHEVLGFNEDVLSDLYNSFSAKKMSLDNQYYFLFVNYLLCWCIENKNKIINYERMLHEVLDRSQGVDLYSLDIDEIIELDNLVDDVYLEKRNLIISITEFFNIEGVNPAFKIITTRYFDELETGYKKLKAKNEKLRKKIKELKKNAK